MTEQLNGTEGWLTSQALQLVLSFAFMTSLKPDRRVLLQQVKEILCILLSPCGHLKFLAKKFPIKSSI